TGVMLRSRLVNRMGRTGTPAVTKSLQGSFLLVLSEMRGNEGWDFGLRGRDPRSPTARLPGI
ncbi:hypothetical protein E3U43_019002, partial [Larimichthys crocea]